MQSNYLFIHPIFLLCAALTGLTPQVEAAECFTPPLSRESTAQLGEVMLQQGHVYPRAAIHLSEEIQFGKDGEYALTPGYYVRSGEGIRWETYVPGDGAEAGKVKKAQGAITLQGAFLYSNDDQTIALITNFYQAVNSEAKGVTRTTRPSLSVHHLQRSVVYGGKEGTQIKLAYRETLKNITRPAGDVYIEFDLADSNVVEIKGARIEILEATQQSIRYRITRSFNTTDK